MRELGASVSTGVAWVAFNIPLLLLIGTVAEEPLSTKGAWLILVILFGWTFGVSVWFSKLVYHGVLAGER